MRHRSPSTEWRGALALGLLLACHAEAPVVSDAAGLLSPAQRTAIAEQHALLLRDHDIDYRVDLGAAAGDVSVHARQRFEALRVGSRSRSGRGLLLVLDPQRDRVRLEVGQRLEGLFTDAFAAYLEERQMLPFFRAGRVADGILAATELVVTHAQEAGDAIDAVGSRRSAGGGADRRAALGAGPDAAFRSGPDVAAAGTPEEAVEAYLNAMRARNGNAALDLYTAETRAMLGGRVVTPGQMDAIAAAYRRCRAEPARTHADGDRAVIRYPAADRTCAPWFLVREAGRWRLDLATSQRLIRFGSGNAWRFGSREAHPYAYAFADWRLDRNGFPHAR